jgi:isoleucyl-tRNA synthetase
MDWPEVSEIENLSEEAEIDAILQFREKIHEKLEMLPKETIIGQSLNAKIIIKGSDKMRQIVKNTKKIFRNISLFPRSF